MAERRGGHWTRCMCLTAGGGAWLGWGCEHAAAAAAAAVGALVGVSVGACGVVVAAAAAEADAGPLMAAGGGLQAGLSYAAVAAASNVKVTSHNVLTLPPAVLLALLLAVVKEPLHEPQKQES
eukprot:scaffold237973_cov19-Tisochrysis_lutea.AAC.1